MGMQQFRAPAIPLPSDEYNRQQFDEIFRALRIYFNQLDSTTPLQLDGLRLLNLATSGYGLPDGTLFRIGEDVKIVVPNIAYPLGVSSVASVGTVTVTIVP
jgi:hypothetical protein